MSEIDRGPEQWKEEFVIEKIEMKIKIESFE